MNSGKPPTVGVCLHLYYPELWPEIAAYLRNVPSPSMVYVSVPSEEAKVEIRAVFPDATLEVAPNIGRDIAPFIASLNAGRFDGCDVVCKIHSKRSTYSERGAEWRRLLYEGVFGSAMVVRAILSAFSRRPKLGMVGPDVAFVRNRYWGKNRERVTELARRMGWKEPVPLAFFAGSMFWFRPEALAPLRSLGVSAADFEAETGERDGTLAHAIERLPVISAWRAGYEVTTESGLDSRVQDMLHNPIIPVLD